MADEKQRAKEALTNLFDTMQKVLGLPPGFAIPLTPQLDEWFKSSDPDKLKKFTDWAEKSAATLR